MGILTQLANNLGAGLIDLGLTQFSNVITRAIQDGRNEDAFRAAGEAEQWLANQINGGNQRSGVLPIGGTDYRMQIPENIGLSKQPTGPMDLTPPEDIMKRINKSQAAVQYFYPRQQQFISNDPYFVAQEQARKLQAIVS